MAGGVIPFANPVDFQKNETRNRRVQNLASAPSSPVEGQEYYDTGLKATRVWDGTAWTNKATDSLLLEGNNSAHHKARANHTGTQTASTISDFDTQVRTSRLDQMAAPTATVSMNSQKIANLLNGTNPQDAATVAQVEAARAGLRKTFAVDARATGNVTISNPGTAVFDGVTLANGEAIALFDQTTDSEKGIYVFNGSGVAMTRLPDASTFDELDAGTEVFVQGGTVHGGKVYRQTTELTAFTGQVWGAVAAGTTYTAGDGLTESPAGTFNVGEGNGIDVTANAVAVDPAVVVRKYAETIGDNSTTSFVVTHNLNTQDIQVTVREVSGNKAQVIVDNEATSVNTATIIFAIAPTTNQYRVIVQG